MQSRHSQSEIAADVDDISVLNASVVVSSINQYSDLHSKVISSNTFEPIFVNEYAPTDPRRRYDYIKSLTVPSKCVKYIYTGGTNLLTFLWKIPIDASESKILEHSIKC